jgi:epoxide hydrolase
MRLVETRQLVAAKDDAIGPYRIDVPEAELKLLSDKPALTRWSEELPHVGWSGGVPLHYLKELASPWHDTYDWGAQGAKLNAFPQFRISIARTNVHFYQARSAHE